MVAMLMIMMTIPQLKDYLLCLLATKKKYWLLKTMNKMAINTYQKSSSM